MVTLVAGQPYNLEITISGVVPVLLNICDFALNQRADGQEHKEQCSQLVSEMVSKHDRIFSVKNV